MANKKKVTDGFMQKPTRFHKDTIKRINKARGSVMEKTGQSISENAFMNSLVEEGLKKFEY